MTKNFSRLFALAAGGQMRKPGVLESQVKRMLRDPKSRALAEKGFSVASSTVLDTQNLGGWPGNEPAKKAPEL